jgi:spore germination protein M
MLKRRALRKIIITTFSLLTVFAICIIPNSLNSKDNFLDTKIDLEYVNNLGTNEIYLLGPNKYLVKTNVLLETDNINTKIRSILDYLTIQKSDKLPTGLSGIIPMNTKVNNVEIKESIVTIDFSKELLDVKEELEERLIEAITYSIINIDGVEAIKIKVDGNLLTELPKTKKKLPELLNRNFGINKVFDIDNLNGIQKVTLYYLDKISNQNYYVPVTKYLNDDREKINIIIDNLSSNYIYESSLVSLLNQNTELINYEIEDEIMTLNFNNSIFTHDKILEEVTYTIKESVCSTYPVKSVILEVEGNIESTNNCN